ncbi:MAG: M23 family metallopeptidase [Oscillospiraceae bacterium]|nr:M23 family metallopeptidase [Oscillospiraceae bacterium]
MKNGNKKNRILSFLQDKGYYIVLFLCVVAVGVAGYMMVSEAVRRGEDSLSVPVTVDKIPSQQEKPTGGEVDTPVMSPEERDELLRQEARKLAVAPMKGEILRPFDAEHLSYNPTTKDWRLHDAVDILASGGEVLSCMAGTVTEVFDHELLGTTVVITHDGGYETRYSNLTDTPVVRVGDLVDPGTVVGAVGTTATAERADEPHLHFQVLLDGEPIDPMEFLK